MLLDEFAAFLRVNKSRTAQEKYVQAAKAFLTYIDADGQTLTRMKGNTLRGFVGWLTTPEQGVRVPGAATVHLMVAGVRSYLDFLRGEDVQVPEQARPDRPRLPEYMPLVLSREQLAIYVDICLKEEDPMGTLLLILPYCGLRIAEACQLRLRDVIWHDVSPNDRRYILHVEKGKGGKERLTPMFTGPSCLVSQAMHLYLMQERPKYILDAEVPKGERWLFPMPASQYIQPVNPKMAQRRVRGWRKPVGMPELHPHVCRGHFATALLSIPLDAIEVARYLGHTKNIDTLANHYAGVRMDDVGEWMGAIARPSQADYQTTLRQGRAGRREQQQRT